MDTTAERQRLENEQRAIQAYLEHPISRKIFEDNEEQQQQGIEYITNVPISDLESFFKHFEAVGHLRGLRRARSIIQDDVEEIEQQLKNLPQ